MGIKWIALILLVVFFLFAIGALVSYKSDFIYIGYEYFARLTRNYHLEKCDDLPHPLVSYTYAELSALPGVIIDESLFLINEEHRIPDDQDPFLVDFGDKLINACMLDSLLKLKEHIQEEYDEQIIIVSAYRDAEHQEDVLSSSKENVAAVVGASEHQYGLGIDIGVAGFGGRSFLKTETGRHVNRHCQEYGFIIRYPLCSSEKTGITYEPWHIRFVGLPHAEIIYKSGMVLEEYIESLTPYAYYEYDSYLISRQEPNNICIPAEFESCNLSLDNTGYCIVTLKTSH